MPERDPILACSGLHLGQWHEANGLTEELLGKKAALDQMHSSDIDRELRNPEIKNVVRPAKGLGIPTAKLVEDVDA